MSETNAVKDESERNEVERLQPVVMCGDYMKDFKNELSDLLDRYGVAIICRNGKEDKDWSLELGFQNMRDGFSNEWLGRFHITSHDLNT